MIEPPKLYTEARRDYDILDMEILSKFTLELGLHIRPDIRQSFENLLRCAGTPDFAILFRPLFDYVMTKRTDARKSSLNYQFNKTAAMNSQVYNTPTGRSEVESPSLWLEDHLMDTSTKHHLEDDPIRPLDCNGRRSFSDESCNSLPDMMTPTSDPIYSSYYRMQHTDYFSTPPPSTYFQPELFCLGTIESPPNTSRSYPTMGSPTSPYTSPLSISRRPYHYHPRSPIRWLHQRHPSSTHTTMDPAKDTAKPPFQKILTSLPLSSTIASTTSSDNVSDLTGSTPTPVATLSPTSVRTVKRTSVSHRPRPRKPLKKQMNQIPSATTAKFISTETMNRTMNTEARMQGTDAKLDPEQQ